MKTLLSATLFICFGITAEGQTQKVQTTDLAWHGMPSIESVKAIPLVGGDSLSMGFPRFDTTKGVVVFYDSLLNVKADSALLIKKADDFYMSGFESDEDKINRKVLHSKWGEASIAVVHPIWYDYKILLLKSGNELPVKQRISFNK